MLAGLYDTIHRKIDWNLYHPGGGSSSYAQREYNPQAGGETQRDKTWQTSRLILVVVVL